MTDIELKLLEQFNRLQQFALKTPVDKRSFWGEWQSLYTTVRLMQIAIRETLEKVERSSPEERFLQRKLRTYKEIEKYLHELKEVALQVKGYSIFAAEESGEEDDDLDDLLF